jgi:hypothetical protein
MPWAAGVIQRPVVRLPAVPWMQAKTMNRRRLLMTLALLFLIFLVAEYYSSRERDARLCSLLTSGPWSQIWSAAQLNGARRENVWRFRDDGTLTVETPPWKEGTLGATENGAWTLSGGWLEGKFPNAIADADDVVVIQSFSGPYKLAVIDDQHLDLQLALKWPYVLFRVGKWTVTLPYFRRYEEYPRKVRLERSKPAADRPPPGSSR